jgi:hypothetical protein
LVERGTGLTQNGLGLRGGSHEQTRTHRRAIGAPFILHPRSALTGVPDEEWAYRQLAENGFALHNSLQQLAERRAVPSGAFRA